MQYKITFLDCPAVPEQEGTAQCGLPAEIKYRYVTGSTDGPVESAMIRCALGHWFNGPVEFLRPSQLACVGDHEVAGSQPALKQRTASSC